jgi:hypothetical protein
LRRQNKRCGPHQSIKQSIKQSINPSFKHAIKPDFPQRKPTIDTSQKLAQAKQRGAVPINQPNPNERKRFENSPLQGSNDCIVGSDSCLFYCRFCSGRLLRRGRMTQGRRPLASPSRSRDLFQSWSRSWVRLKPRAPLDRVGQRYDETPQRGHEPRFVRHRN